MITTVNIVPANVKKFFEIYGFKGDSIDARIDKVCEKLDSLNNKDLGIATIEAVVGTILRQEFNDAAILIGETDNKHQLFVQVNQHEDFHAIGIRIVLEDFQFRIHENLRAKTFRRI